MVVQVDVVCDVMIASGLTVMNSTNTLLELIQLLEKLTVYTAVAGTADVLVSVPVTLLAPEPEVPPPRPEPSIGVAHE